MEETFTPGPYEKDCIFCRIVRGEAPARDLERTDEYIAIHDSAPQAPVHVLVIPTIHVPTLSAYVDASDEARLGRLLGAASRIGVNTRYHGFRVVINEGADAHQTVFHLHLHMLAGRQLRWPPG